MKEFLYRMLTVIVALSLTLSIAGPLLAEGGSTDSGGTTIDTDTAVDEGAVPDMGTPLDEGSTTGEEAPARIWTDKEDYSPGETVIIYGEGFEPWAAVTLTVVRPDGREDQWTCYADGDGAFQTTYQLNGIEGTYTVTATDGTNTATTTFTDAAKVGSVTVGAQSPNPVTAGSSATYTITVNRGSGGGSSGSFTAYLTITTTLPTGVAYSFSPNPVDFTSKEDSETSTLTITTSSATPAGTTVFTVKAATSPTDYAEGNGTLNVTKVNTPLWHMTRR